MNSSLSSLYSQKVTLSRAMAAFSGDRLVNKVIALILVIGVLASKGFAHNPVLPTLDLTVGQFVILKQCDSVQFISEPELTRYVPTLTYIDGIPGGLIVTPLDPFDIHDAEFFFLGLASPAQYTLTVDWFYPFNAEFPTTGPPCFTSILVGDPQELDAYGFHHRSLGGATLAQDSGCIIVSNIGSSTADGVATDLGEVACYSTDVDFGQAGVLSFGSHFQGDTFFTPANAGQRRTLRGSESPLPGV